MRVLVLTLLVACSTTTSTDSENDSECTSAADCGGELACIGPDDFGQCGIGPQEECDEDGCGPDLVCHLIVDCEVSKPR